MFGGSTHDAVEQKLTAARTWLIIDKPFLGALVLRLPMLEGDKRWCRTTATDARALYYNREYIDSLSLEQTKFILAHEALHCALSHFARRQHRVKHRWDVACDYAINPLLISEGLSPPPGALIMPVYEGMTAEEIYPYIKDNNADETLDQHLYDEDDTTDRADTRGSQGNRGGQGQGDGDSNQTPEPQAGGDKPREGEGERDRGQTRGETDPNAGGSKPQPPPLSPAERDALGVQWQQRLAGAAQQAMQAGKLGGSLARLVDHLLQPQLPWRMLLARYMTSGARTDYSFMRPSRREGNAILPSLHSKHIDVAVVIDTSGSISANEMQEFVSEVNAIKSAINARITLHACDLELADEGPWTYEPWEEVRLPEKLAGGGGTDFRPAFAWAECLDRQPDLMLYFTDAKGDFPGRPPAFPVLWLIKGKEKIPWGQRIQLN